jgi:hypothetical protein
MVARCLALEVNALLVLYADCSRDEAPGAARIPAIALREKARAGALPVEIVPVLAVALGDAEDGQIVRNLAKALAAFGPRARLVVRALVEKLGALHVTDDDSFWTFDSLIHALAYVGGDEARAALDELAARRPSPVLRSKGLYRGGVKEPERARLFAETLARAGEIVAADSPEGWREKRTEMAALPIEKQQKIAPWRAR